MTALLLLLGIACKSDEPEVTFSFGGPGESGQQMRCVTGETSGCLAAAEAAEKRNDPSEAATFARIGCDGNDGRSCYKAGLLAGGSDPESATGFYRRGCDLGEPGACNNLGVLLQGAGDFTGMADALEKGCTGGDASACGNLGIARFTGEQVAKDISAAMALWEKGCTGGHGRSCHNLGTLYLDGVEGITVDAKRGETYLLHGCDAGFAQSCADLSIELKAGKLLPLDVARAAELAAKACALGDVTRCL